jgi:hypothetical protein
MDYRNLVYAAIEGRPEAYPQDLVGILSHIGPDRDVLSEADQDRFPNHAELSFSLEDLIRGSRIAEASPMRYYDTVGQHRRELSWSALTSGQRRPAKFSGISPEEYENACAAYYREVQEKRAWKVDAATCPELNIGKGGIDGSWVFPSPDGQFACVIYSVDEINMGRDAGHIALCKGPPEKPAVIFRASADVMCLLDDHHWRCIQWLDGSRYCVMQMISYRPAHQDTFYGLTFLDLVNEAFAQDHDIGSPFIVFEKHGSRVIRHRPDDNSDESPEDQVTWEFQERTLVPAELAWHSWQDLAAIKEKPTRRIWQRIRSWFG